MSEVEKLIEDKTTCILVGNKSDLEGQRVVSFDEGLEMSNHYGIRFLETSAKEDRNVETVFTTLIREVWNNSAQNQPQHQVPQPQ